MARGSFWKCAVMAGLVLVSANVVGAAVISGSFRVTFVSDDGVTGSANWPINVDLPSDNDEYNWSAPTTVIMSDDGQSELATIWRDASQSPIPGASGNTGLHVIADPVVGLNFAVSTGAVGGTFTIDSPLLAFGAIANPVGLASAAVTVTDFFPGSTNGLSGNFAGPSAYRAETNAAVVGGGTQFAALIGDLAGPGVATDSTMPIGMYTAANLPLAVTTMSSQFSFDLGAFDAASGTSVFEVVPEPSTGLLLLAGVTVFLRRRR